MLPYANLAVIASLYTHVGDEWKYIDRGMRTLLGKHAGAAFTRIVFRNSQNYHDFEIATIWQSLGRGYSSDSDEGSALLGKSFTKAIIGEGSHVHPEILERKILRALDRARTGAPRGYETGHLTIFTTPKGYEGASASEWERVHRQTRGKPARARYGLVPFAQSVYLRSATVLENPDYDPEVFEARKATLDKFAFEEQYLGQKGHKTGTIVKAFTPGHHVRPMPPASVVSRMRLGVGIDTGGYFGATIAGLYDPTPTTTERWILAETYTAQLDAEDNAKELRETVVSVLGPLLGTDDYALLRDRIDVWQVDPASQIKLDLEKYLEVTLSWLQLSVEETIEHLNTWFKHDTLWLAEGTTDTLADQIKKLVWIQQKSYGTNRSGGVARQPVITVPKKGYDHLIDAGRMVLEALELEGPLVEPPSPITFADAWRGQQREAIHGPLREQLDRAERAGGVWV